MELRDIRHQQPMHQRISVVMRMASESPRFRPLKLIWAVSICSLTRTQLSAQLLSLRGYLIAVRQAIEQSSAKTFFQAC